MPKVEWFEYMDWGKTAGKTYENGQIYLVHPENWKKGRKYNSERRWINTVYHELGHYIFWTDAETKANNFALRMVRGVNNHHK
jgi:predicted SprT family Zn-dependent metalloprotease